MTAAGPLLLLLAAQGAAVPAEAGLALVDRLAGEYRHAGGEEDRRRVARGIDAVADKASWVVRGPMRSRLHASNGIPERLSIVRRGDEVHIGFNGPARVTRIGAPPVRVTARSGDELRYTLSVADGRLVQRFEGARGGRINRFRLDGDRLIVEVTIFSPRLPANVEYELRYARAR